MENLRMSQQFIECIRSATLDSDHSKLPDKTVEALLNDPPSFRPEELDDRFVQLSLNLFRACIHTSRQVYVDICKAIVDCYGDDGLMSYYRCQKTLEKTSGVIEVKYDMCEDTCAAFTGPFSDLDTCPVCGKERWEEHPLDPTRRVAKRTFSTFPIGPQIQALRRSPEGAAAMQYGYFKARDMANILDNAHENGPPAVYDDIVCGEEFLKLFATSDFNEHDTSIVFSIDSAQLFRNNRDTEVLIGICWTPSLPPSTRYKMTRVFVSFIIPGRPKNYESFLFPTLYHISALQHANNGAGLAMWSAVTQHVEYSRIFFLLGTADIQALIHLDGRVGHHGRYNCRIGCRIQGWHKPGDGFYFCPHLRPHGDIEGPEDFDFRNPAQLEVDAVLYDQHLRQLLQTEDQRGFEAVRLLTGLSKPSPLSGLAPVLMPPIPFAESVDLMHLLYLNMGELFIDLWRGTMACSEPDSKEFWEWLVLADREVWERLGKLVADATAFFPAFFHRTPRDPSKKWNSGYKATEVFLFIWGLGPGLFKSFLPEAHYKNFCHAARAVRILTQRSLPANLIVEAHQAIIQFVEGFENLYYQRRPDRIQFCRPCIHTLLHLAPEAFRTGPGCLTSQFTLERTIGFLIQDIRQPSNPYANLSQIAMRRTQVNSLIAVCPELDKPARKVPRGAVDLGDGIMLLRPQDASLPDLTPAETNLLRQAFQVESVLRWGRYSLPSGYIARSLYCEARKKKRPRVTRNVKVCISTFTFE